MPLHRPLFVFGFLLSILSDPAVAPAGSSSVNSARDGVANEAPPFAFTLRAGVLRTTDFDWFEPTGEPASQAFGALGLSLEVHRIHGLILGAGIDGTLQWWSSPTELYRFGPTTQHIATRLLYGSVGTYIWKNQHGGAASWASADLGRISASEDRQGPGFGSGSSFAGTVYRLRVSWMSGLNSGVAFGVDAGWQWAEPRRRYNRHETPEPNPPHLNLSGPMISARLSLVGPLGRDR